MKFNAVEVLPSLLDKTKGSTIRKALEETRVQPENLEGWDIKQDCGDGCCHLFTRDKPAKWKVGDVVEAVWYDKESAVGRIDQYGRILPDKIFGKVRITKVEKIEVKYTTTMFMTRDGKKCNKQWIRRLAKHEGFSSAREMFDYLEKYAGSLAEGKPFWYYTFEWVK